MFTAFRVFVLVLLSCIAFGCAGKQEDSPVTVESRAERFRHSFESALGEEQAQASQALVSKAHSAIGTPYVLGGSAPGGFDCSGLVSWAYKSVGVKLPRTAREQSVIGKGITDPSKMRAGDIVAFHHPKRGYHTGIYVGDGKFIHSPRRRTKVRINSLSDPYFNKTFLSARRVSLEAGTNLVAEAQSRLVAYANERNLRAPAKLNAKLSSGRAAVKKSPKSNKVTGKSGKSATTQVAAAGRKGSKRTLVAAQTVKPGKNTTKSASSTPKNRISAKSVQSRDNRLAGIKGRQAVAAKSGKLVATKSNSKTLSQHKSFSVSQNKSRKTVADKGRRS